MLSSSDANRTEASQSEAKPALPASDEGRAGYREYTQGVDPVTRGIMPRVPLQAFSPELYARAVTQVIPLDLSRALQTKVLATSPALCAHFIHILPGDAVSVGGDHAASELYYVLRGRGSARHSLRTLRFSAGDFFTMPCGAKTLTADTDAVLYYVNDAPLLAHLGVTATKPRFEPVIFCGKGSRAALQQVQQSPKAAHANRVSVIIVDETNPLTLSATPILWSMLGILPQGAVQAPHRHQSVALDLIVDCAPGCYSLVGKRLDTSGAIVNPERVPWEAGMAFTTPPGLWHAHYNESGADAYLAPVQDAGLHTYLRSLDIRFA